MERPEEACQAVGRLLTTADRGSVARLAGNPGRDHPRLRETCGRFGHPYGRRYGERKARSEDREPLVFLAKERRGARRTGQPDGQVLPKAPQLVVPAGGHLAEG
ncbi:hypothetical protein GCM10023317_54860 [Actinopolymorpha pittospori]